MTAIWQGNFSVLVLVGFWVGFWGVYGAAEAL